MLRRADANGGGEPRVERVPFLLAFVEHRFVDDFQHRQVRVELRQSHRKGAPKPVYTGAELGARLQPRDPLTPNRQPYSDTDENIRRRFLRTEWTRADVQRLAGLELGEDLLHAREPRREVSLGVSPRNSRADLPDLEPEWGGCAVGAELGGEVGLRHVAR